MRITDGDQWIDLRDVSSLTGADQDAYLDEIDRRRGEDPGPVMVPDPANPAVMMEAPSRAGRLTGGDMRAIRDLVIGWVVTGWSFDLPLPYTSDSRKSLPLAMCNKLIDAVSGHVEALNGNDPKDQDSSSGSADTSPDSTVSLLPESVPELSAIASG